MTDALSRFEMPPTERNQIILAGTRVHTYCRVCGSQLIPAFELGPMFVSDFPKRLEDRGPKVPLTLAVCASPRCSLVQLTHTVPRDALYRTRYWYRSGVNESMRTELDRVVRWGLDHLTTPLLPDDMVLDIGANDGTLLESVRAREFGVPPILWAVEPSPTFTDWLLEEGIVDRVIADYFPPQLEGYRRDPDWLALTGKVKLIFSIAMFYDLEDPNEFVAEIARILHPEGVWVVQMGDLASMLNSGGFDTICHEHLELYSLRSFIYLCSRHKLEVVDVAHTVVNGGSLRIAVTRASDLRVWSEEGQDRTNQLLRDEAEIIAGPEGEEDEILALRRFREGVQQVCSRLQRALLAHTSNDVPLELLGASTKGNTLLQRLNLGPELCRRAIERASEKAGRLTVSGIPIVGEKDGCQDPATLRLVLPWHFKTGLVAREKPYLLGGGRLVFPLPRPTLVWMANGEVRELEF